ncbi:nucleoporin 88 [Gadus morhua]|uniref:Nuclear pore complex protein Nup88 n=1 Tax=Gadus morhua TaxID=8049 RepID=A0A8C5A5S5_GADMO|nr:nuclear pore complex protein Nup88 [Gadus morhua]
MAAFGGERWLHELPNHNIFSKLREILDSEPKANVKRAAKNLTFCLDCDLFVWNDVDRVFFTTNLRQLNSDESFGSGNFQTLLCINPPRFEVCQVLLSPTQHHVALIGQRGVSVLELPQRWGKRSEFEGGRSDINCKTIPVAERFFTSSASVTLRQATWYPSETEEPNLVLLTSDNTIRFYGLKSPQNPTKVLPVSQSEEDSNVHSRVLSYAASLGEIAVAFDFGPVSCISRQVPGQASRDLLVYPLYILYENGETYLSYTSNQMGVLNLSKPAGPLPMYPAAEDNYGYDACAILCLPCVPNILVIATETGMLYHCVVLESEEEEDEGGVGERWMRGSDSVPSLYVFECVELELTLKLATGDDEEPQESDFTCPIRLHRDPLCQHRYHCTHEAGVHSVGLTWFNKLHQFLGSSDEGDRNSLQELAAEKRCIVEHILCTRPLATSLSAPVRGFLVTSDLSLGATMVCITSAYECILLPLLSSVRPPSPPLLCSGPRAGPVALSPLSRGPPDDSFERHVRNILARGSANPLVLRSGDSEGTAAAAAPPPEWLQLLSRATQVFREEYVLKQDTACEELQRRSRLLATQRGTQADELAACRLEKRSLREAAERLADKYEDAKYRQDAIARRVKRLLGGLRSQLPVLSDSEKDMRKELQGVEEQLKHLDNGIRQVAMKREYQKKQVDKAEGGGPALPSRGGVSLNAHQKKCVQGVLREHGEQISTMMKQIKDIKNTFSF